MDVIRPSAAAGLFYPAAAQQLYTMIAKKLHDSTCMTQASPKAIIVPHASYVYSGAIAASAYNQLVSLKTIIRRVILLGPSHHEPFEGLAISSANWFETPLGLIPVDSQVESQLIKIAGVSVNEAAHAREHSLEVQLPFLQYLLGEFKIVPIVVAHASPSLVTEVLDSLAHDTDTLIVISSDLSHYLDYDSACKTDTETSQAIVCMESDVLDSYHACGYVSINGLLLYARQHHMCGHVLDLRNSGDTTGKRNSVVGYGAYLFQAS